MKVFKSMCIFLLFLFLVPSRFVFAEEHTPEPYTSNEFPNWSKDLGRLGIVTLGSIPFSLLITTVSYDTYRFFLHDRDSAYAPLFFKSGNGVAYTEKEQRNLFFISAGVSLTAGLVDLGIQHFKRRKTHQEELTNKRGVIELLPDESSALPVNNPENNSENNDANNSENINENENSFLNENRDNKVDEELLSYVLSTTGGVLLPQVQKVCE